MIKTIAPGTAEPRIDMFDGIVYSKVHASLTDEDLDLKILIMMDNKLTMRRPGTEVTERRPTLLWLMGGGWRACPREKAMAEWLYFAKRGYIVAAATYRTSVQDVWPSQIIDSLAAVRFLRANADKYCIDPDRIGVMGLSAGGHLSAMVGMNPEEYGSDDWKDYSSEVQAAIVMFGPTDLPAINEINKKKPRRMPPMQPANNAKGELGAKMVEVPSMGPSGLSAEELMIGGEIHELMDKAIDASPMSHISDKAAPMLILHGSNDNTVDISQSYILHDKLNEIGHETDMYVLEGAGHNTAEFYQDSVKQVMVEFLDKYLK